MSFSRIAVATDGSANAERALTTAIDIARHYDAKLVLVHAVMGGALPQNLLKWAKVEHLVDDGTAGAGSAEQRMPPAYGRLGVITHDERVEIPHAARIAVGRAIVEHSEAKVHDAGLSAATSLIEEGDPATVIARAIESENADLVVVGTRGLGTLKGLVLGSVSHKVVGLKHCPCLTVP